MHMSCIPKEIIIPQVLVSPDTQLAEKFQQDMFYITDMSK
jgi:hypothetical protein